VAAAAVVIALVFATIWIRGRTGKQGTAAVAKASGQHLMLAVLPFENLTGDATQEYFSDGMTEEMIAQLGRLDPARMSVIARTSVMRFKNSADALDQVKQQLGVQYVLEGSVRRENDRVRVTAQLIKTQDQTRVWGKEYDRELSNLLGLQAEIAGEIAREVDLNLAAPDGTAAGTEERLRPERLAAYDLYLRGRYFWNKRHEADLKLAAQIFQQAVAKDPEYARGYAGLADAYALLATYRIVPQEQAMPKARAAAQKALELDATLAEAHTSLALVVEFYDWNWSAAEQEYRRAIELDPNYATAHQWYAEELAIVGRFPEAMGEIEQARTLDPLSVIIDADYGTIQYLSRRYDAAIQRYHAVLEMEPEFPRGFGIIMPLVQERRYTEALAWLERWAAKVGPNHGWWWCYLTYVYASMGEMGKARHALEKLLALKGALRSELTVAWMSTGNKEKALEYLEADYARRTIPVFVGVDPLYDPLRGEPRFQKILQGMGLAR
jgi:TolB-like protein/Tfp pilus assembly protein PilF